MAGSGRLSLSLSAEQLAQPVNLRSGPLAAGRYAVIRVRDVGPGIPEALLPRVLDPFFTTRAGAGTGLGLPMVANFATDNRGALDIVSKGEGEGESGTLVEIWLPQIEQLQGKPAPAEPRDPDRVRILVVEDEPLVGRFVVRSLTRAGYEVELLETADAACERLVGGAVFDLVLSDIGLPGKMDGVDLARWIAAQRPELIVLLSSGYASDGLADDLHAAMLPKPYDARTLSRTVDELLAARV